jgi:hypothetical protein
MCFFNRTGIVYSMIYIYNLIIQASSEGYDFGEGDAAEHRHNTTAIAPCLVILKRVRCFEQLNHLSIRQASGRRHLVF